MPNQYTGPGSPHGVGDSPNGWEILRVIGRLHYSGTTKRWRYVCKCPRCGEETARWANQLTGKYCFHCRGESISNTKRGKQSPRRKTK